MASVQETAGCHPPHSPTCESSSPFPPDHLPGRHDHRPWHEGNPHWFPSAESSDPGGLMSAQAPAKHEEGDLSDDGPAEWTPSKITFMRRMMNSDGTAVNDRRRIVVELQDQPESEEDKTHSDHIDNRHCHVSVAPTRVCSDCNTTKTPLWRSGPQGPKSLCNACGIRQRKARRAMAAAAAAGLTGGLIPTVAPSKVRKEKTSGFQRTVPFKKRCRLTPGQTRTSLLFDEFTISLSKSSALHRVFPQDEKEAALLLMALSSGLIRG